MYICFDNEHSKSKLLLMLKEIECINFRNAVQTKCHLNCMRATVGGETRHKKREWRK
jgi:hypothetical protein